MTDRLDGKVAIVTGASMGIGEATARALSAEGASVVLAARGEDALHTVAEDIRSEGGEALALPTDVTERDQLRSLFDATLDEFGRLDVMVNNAGVGHWDRQGIAEGDLDEWRLEIDVNLVALMEGTKLAADVFLEQGSGHIVNVSSGAGRAPFPQFPGYVTSKWGVRGFTGSARNDLKPHGIRVTLVEPGEVDTRMNAGEPEADREQMLRPEDIADFVLFAVTRPEHVTIADGLIVPNGFQPGGGD